MDRSFVEAVREGAAPAVVAESVRRDGSLILAHEKWKELLPIVPRMDVIELRTLSGFVAYIKDVDEHEASAFVHVASPTEVHLVSLLGSEATRYRRNVYAAAIARPRTHKFGQFLDYEEFVIWLQSGFVQSVASSALLAFLGSIKDSAVRETADNGLAQTVSARAGIELVDAKQVPNPIRLAPFRTFMELSQPDGLFVLRLRGMGGAAKPQAALFEADGGEWQLDAVESIRSYLAGELAVGTKIIA